MRSLRKLMDLHGKHAVVTGGTGWLGHAMVETLVELGATVTSVTRGDTEQFGDQLQHDGIAVVEADLTNRADIESFLDGIARVDILVNNMCVQPQYSDFLSEGYDSWSHIETSLDTNLVGQMFLTKAIVNEHMPDGGCIVNLASVYGKLSPDPKLGDNPLEYGMAKAAIIQSTRYMAAHLGDRNIRCNSISPGHILRPDTLSDKPDILANLQSRTMLGRIGNAEDLKGVIALLTTDLGAYITGQDIVVDGGWTSW